MGNLINIKSTFKLNQKFTFYFILIQKQIANGIFIEKNIVEHDFTKS